jgi:hypothetical protein
MMEIVMKNFKHEFKEWLIVAAQGSIFLVMLIVFIFVAMSAGCGGRETVRPSVDTEEVTDGEEDLDEVVDEFVDEVDSEDVDEVTEEEESDADALDEEEDSDEVPDEAVEGGWTQVVTAYGGSTGSTTCGIYKNLLYCWGTNYTGVFGNGTQIDSSEPVLAGGGKEWKVFLMEFGKICALDLEGVLYCWGSNYYATFATADIEMAVNPFKISDRPFINLSCINDNLWEPCVLTATGQEWCLDYDTKKVEHRQEGITGYWPSPVPEVMYWSKNHKIGLLNGGRVVVRTGVQQYKDWPNPLRNISEISLLTQIDGSLSDDKTGAGWYCATDLNKELWCWGTSETDAEDKKHIGDYTLWYNSILSDIINFSKALTHTCAVTTAGRLYCWGSNKEGQLGLGYASDTAVTEPQEVIVY